MQADLFTNVYHRPSGMGGREAREREATWMRPKMFEVLGAAAYKRAPKKGLIVINAEPIKYESSFGLRLRPVLLDYYADGRGVVFINLGAGKNLQILQDWGHEGVPCGTEGCDGATTLAVGRELGVVQVLVLSARWACCVRDLSRCGSVGCRSPPQPSTSDRTGGHVQALGLSESARSVGALQRRQISVANPFPLLSHIPSPPLPLIPSELWTLPFSTKSDDDDIQVLRRCPPELLADLPFDVSWALPGSLFRLLRTVRSALPLLPEIHTRPSLPCRPPRPSSERGRRCCASPDDMRTCVAAAQKWPQPVRGRLVATSRAGVRVSRL